MEWSIWDKTVVSLSGTIYIYPIAFCMVRNQSLNMNYSHNLRGQVQPSSPLYQNLCYFMEEISSEQVYFFFIIKQIL